MALEDLLNRCTAQSTQASHTTVTEVDSDLYQENEPEDKVRIKCMLGAFLRGVVLDLAGDGDLEGAPTHPEKLRQQYRNGAMSYVFESDPNDLFSFEFVCDSLGVDVQWFREQVKLGRATTWAKNIRDAGKVHYLAASDGQKQRAAKRLTSTSPTSPLLCAPQESEDSSLKFYADALATSSTKSSIKVPLIGFEMEKEKNLLHFLGSASI